MSNTKLTQTSKPISIKPRTCKEVGCGQVHAAIPATARFGESMENGKGMFFWKCKCGTPLVVEFSLGVSDVADES